MKREITITLQYGLTIGKIDLNEDVLISEYLAKQRFIQLITGPTNTNVMDLRIVLITTSTNSIQNVSAL